MLHFFFWVRWPPAFFVGLVLCASGYALVDYCAKRFYSFGLSRRLLDLWMLPFALLVVVIGFRLMVLGYW